MKQIVKVILTMLCVAWLLASCPTTNTVEKRTERVENQRKTKVDSVTLQTADSVLVLVEKSDSNVRIIERTVKWREKVKVQRDTVRVYLSNDTIIMKESVTEKATRSPPRWKLYLALGLLTTAFVAVILQTIKKHFKL